MEHGYLPNKNGNIISGWWFQRFFIFHFIYRMSFFPLTFTLSFFKMFLQPPIIYIYNNIHGIIMIHGNPSPSTMYIWDNSHDIWLINPRPRLFNSPTTPMVPVISSQLIQILGEFQVFGWKKPWEIRWIPKTWDFPSSSRIPSFLPSQKDASHGAGI